MICYLGRNGIIICDIRKDIIHKSSRICRCSGWMNDVWQEMLGKEEINIISNSCTRVIIQVIILLFINNFFIVGNKITDS